MLNNTNATSPPSKGPAQISRPSAVAEILLPLPAKQITLAMRIGDTLNSQFILIDSYCFVVGQYFVGIV
jgi:hypothetical protein